MDGYLFSYFRLKFVLFAAFFLSPSELFCPLNNINSASTTQPTGLTQTIDLSSLIQPESSNPGYSIFTSNNIFIDPKTGTIVDGTGKKITSKIQQPIYKPDYTLEKTVLKEIVKIPFGKEKAGTKAVFSGTLLVLNTLSACNELLKTSSSTPQTNSPDAGFSAVSFWTAAVAHYTSSPNPSVMESIKNTIISTNAQPYARKLMGSLVEFTQAQALRVLINHYGSLMAKGKTLTTLNNYADVLNSSFQTAKHIATGTATAQEIRRFKLIKRTTSFLNKSRSLFRNKKITISDMPEALQGAFFENKDFITGMLKKTVAEKMKSLQNAALQYAQQAKDVAQKYIIDGVEYIIEKAQKGTSYIITEIATKKQFVVEQLQSLQTSCIYTIQAVKDNAAYFIQTTKDGLQQVGECTLSTMNSVKTTLSSAVAQTTETISNSSSAAFAIAQDLAFQAAETTAQGVTVIKESVNNTATLTVESIKTMSSFAQATAVTGGSLLWNTLMTAPTAVVDGINSFSQTTLNMVSTLLTPTFDLTEIGTALDTHLPSSAPLSADITTKITTLTKSDAATIQDLEAVTDSLDDDIFEDALDYFTEHALSQEIMAEITPSDLPNLTDSTLQKLKTTLLEEKAILNKAVEETTSTTIVKGSTAYDLNQTVSTTTTTSTAENPTSTITNTTQKIDSSPSMTSATTPSSISLQDLEKYEYEQSQKEQKNQTINKEENRKKEPIEEFVL